MRSRWLLASFTALGVLALTGSPVAAQTPAPSGPAATPGDKTGATPASPMVYGEPTFEHPWYDQPPTGPAHPPVPSNPRAGSPPPPIKPLLINECCRWSIRVDPFDLIYRRATVQAEIRIVGPLSIEITPSWIFGSPYADLAETGYSLGGNVGFYFLSGQALRGMWVKLHATYEHTDVTVTHPQIPSSTGSATASTAVLGGMIGTNLLLPGTGGFVLSGGVGIGVATANPLTITAPGNPSQNIGDYSATLFENLDKIRLLGTFGLGVAF